MYKGYDAEANDYAQTMQEQTKPLLSECPPSVKAGFITRVYTLLSIQLMLTAGVAAAFGQVVSVREFVTQRYELNLFIGIVGLFTICGLFSMANRHPWNIVLLTAFTLCEAYGVGYVTAVYCEAGRGLVIVGALVCTMVAFGALSLYVHVTRKDFRFLEGFLLVGLLVLVTGGLVAAFVPSLALQTLVASGGVLVFSGYILYDTSELIHRMGPDDTIIAVVSLYLDVINLFLYLVQLLTLSSNSE